MHLNDQSGMAIKKIPQHLKTSIRLPTPLYEKVNFIFFRLESDRYFDCRKKWSRVGFFIIGFAAETSQ